MYIRCPNSLYQLLGDIARDSPYFGEFVVIVVSIVDWRYSEIREDVLLKQFSVQTWILAIFFFASLKIEFIKLSKSIIDQQTDGLSNFDIKLLYLQIWNRFFSFLWQIYVMCNLPNIILIHFLIIMNLMIYERTNSKMN
jgi:hypothetical protein